MFGKIINMDYDIPYVAGYSLDGSTIYIDKNLPQSFMDTRGNIHYFIPALILHEAVEKMLLGTHTFNEAHKIALAAEHAELHRLNIPTDEYYGFLYMHVHTALEKMRAGESELPADLDLLPYHEDGLI